MIINISIDTNNIAQDKKERELVSRLLDALLGASGVLHATAAHTVRHIDSGPALAVDNTKKADTQTVTETLIPAAKVETAVTQDDAPTGPSLDDLKNLMTRIMGHPKAGGPKAVTNTLQRFGAECLVNGKDPLAKDKYAEVAVELENLLRIADAA